LTAAAVAEELVVAVQVPLLEVGVVRLGRVEGHSPRPRGKTAVVAAPAVSSWGTRVGGSADGWPVSEGVRRLRQATRAQAHGRTAMREDVNAIEGLPTVVVLGLTNPWEARRHGD